MRKLIQGGTVVSGGHETVADVLIDGEEIAAVGSVGSSGTWTPRSSTRAAATCSRA